MGDRRARVAVLVVLAAGLAFFLYLVRGVLAPFVLALVVAFVLEPPVRLLESRGVGRPTAIALVYVVVGGAVIVFLLWLIPLLVSQLTVLAETLPSLGRRVEAFIAGAQARYAQYELPPQVRQVVEEAVVTAQVRLLRAVQAAIEGLLRAVSAVAVLLLAPFLAYYLLRDRDLVRRWVLRMLPMNVRRETLQALAEANRVVSGYIRGQLVVALAVGLLVGAGTWLLGLPFSAILGIVAGVANIIPYFGPVIGAVPAVLLALLESPLLALETVAVFLVIQQIDNLFITPRVLGDHVGLHPLVVIFSLLAGAELFGLPGAVLAVPVVAVGKVFLKHLYGRLVSGWRP